MSRGNPANWTREPERPCAQCQAPFRPFRYQLDAGGGKVCSRACADASKAKGVDQAFWPFIDKTGAGGCWIWTAGVSGAGYGTLKIHGQRRVAHRVSYELANGPIEGGLFVLHRCDVRRCCNPEHLFLGEQQDNMDDMRQKGRGASKLRAEDIPAIRSAHAAGVTPAALAATYGVSRRTVVQAATGKTWRWLEATR